MTRRFIPGLANLGVQAQIGDELARRAKAGDVADGRHQRRRGPHADAGDRHQALGLGRGHDPLAEPGVDRLDLIVEEADLAQAALHALGLHGGALLAGEPGPARLAKQVRDRRAPEQAAGEGRVALVLCTGPLAHQRRPPRDPAPQRLRSGVGHPDRFEHAGVKQAGQHAGIEAVGLDPRVGDRPHVLSVGDDHAGHVGLQDSRDLHRRPGRLHHHLVCGVEALGEELKRGSVASQLTR